MKYRKLGKQGIKVSEISLGAWLTYGGSVEDEMATKCIHTALENKINFIDVADIYAKGQAERVVGRALSEEQYRRKDLVVSSKVFWPMSENINDVGLSRKHIFDSIEQTLDRFNFDYLDIYFCHRFDHQTPLEETAMAMHDLIKDGFIRYWGTSVWSAKQLERVIGICKENKLILPAVEQPKYHMLDRTIELEIMETCSYHGLGIVPWSPLAQGVLTGKYNNGIPEDSRAGQGSEFIKADLTEEKLSKVKQIGELANNLGVKTSQLALAWILRRFEISSVITGATKIEQILENIKAIDVELDSPTLEQIEKILNNKPQFTGPYSPALINR
jgi:voltage-dependent potassium channel beta subunit